MTEKPRARAAAVFKATAIGAVALVVIAFIAVFFVVPGPMIHTAARVAPGMAFATIDDRDVVVISYTDDAYAGLGSIGTQGAHVTAIDLGTGETVWDRRIDTGGSAPTVLAAGDEFAYLLDFADLYVISLFDGSVVTHGEDITGLEGFDFFPAEIIYSPQQNAIMLGSGEGPVLEIVLDTLEAVEADESTSGTWSCVLDWSGYAYFYDTPEPVLLDWMPIDDGTLGFGVPTGAAPGTPGKRLSFSDGKGSSVAVGPETFVDGQFVAESVMNEPRPGACETATWERDVFPDDETTPVPIGSASGFVILEHDVSARDGDRAISIVDSERGELLGSNAAEWGVTHARNAPGGGAAVIVDRFLPGVLPALTVPVTSVVVLIAEDGTMQEIILAKHGWFGLPW